MKITKGYVVAYEYGWYEMVFTNEVDRNEMALAIYEEMLCYTWGLFLNWYDENNLEEAARVVKKNLFIYETMIVEAIDHSSEHIPLYER